MSDTASVALPLQGKRILITRTREQASVLRAQVQRLGAKPIEFPTIRIVPPQEWTALDAALKQLYGTATDHASYNWLVFTSANGVRICCERLQQLGYEPQAIEKHIRIATIGPATASTLEKYGLKADLVPDEYIAEGVASAILADAQAHGVSLQGQRILLARAAEARKVLATQLSEAGALVDDVAAYYTHIVEHEDEQGRDVLRLLQEHHLDVLTFTSSSTVKNFVSWLKSCEQHSDGSVMQLVTMLPRPCVACIGPITAQTARELGLPVDIAAKEFTIDGLVQAIIDYYSSEEKQ